VSAEQRLARRASAARSTCSRTTPTRPATPTAATRTTSPAGATTSATTPRCSSRSSSAARSTPAPARSCRPPAAPCSRSASAPSTSGRASPAPPPAAASHHQHPRRAPRRRRALPPPPRDRRRLEHERVRHLPEGRGPPACMLRMLEDPNVVLRDMTLENPIRAIREISHDITCTAQGAVGQRARGVGARHPARVPRPGAPLRRDPWLQPRGEEGAGDVGARHHHHRERPALARPRGRLGDQAQPHRALPRAARLPSDPPGALLDLQYHDISRDRSLFYKLQDRGLVERMCTDADIDRRHRRSPRRPPGPASAASSSRRPRSASATTPSTGCT
jgi:hypothetical protein